MPVPNPKGLANLIERSAHALGPRIRRARADRGIQGKELIAPAVSLVSRCHYCSLADEAMALMSGASEQQIIEAKEVVELFSGSQENNRVF